LRKARILLIGLQGFGAEICKNIILAGVKAVTILDGGVVTEEDACSQFLAARDQLGKNVSNGYTNVTFPNSMLAIEGPYSLFLSRVL
jgi:molybdopterin/thiamine biosynthesis adenylyltransferase